MLLQWEMMFSIWFASSLRYMNYNLVMTNAGPSNGALDRAVTWVKNFNFGLLGRFSFRDLMQPEEKGRSVRRPWKEILSDHGSKARIQTFINILNFNLFVPGFFFFNKSLLICCKLMILNVYICLLRTCVPDLQTLYLSQP